MTVVEYFRGLLREAFGGSPVVLLSGAMQPDLVRSARELGCAGVFALGNRPDPGADAYSRFHSPEWRQELDRFDPENAALAMGDGFRTTDRLAGRRFVGPRPEEWARYEDKTELGALLVHVGVPCAPESVVPADATALLDAATELDAGLGTVWSGDHRDGEQNGGKHVRWVRTAAQASAATAYFGTQCDRVRVMPFLEGQACSVHGVVMATGMAILRPIALDIRVDLSKGIFEYMGCDIDWNPRSDAEGEIRRVARRIGAGLGEAVDYRGAFCVDGVLTDEGFWPTEVNTRCGDSLTYIARRLPELPLRFLHAFIADGYPADWRPHELERVVLSRLAGRGPAGRPIRAAGGDPGAARISSC